MIVIFIIYGCLEICSQACIKMINYVRKELGKIHKQKVIVLLREGLVCVRSMREYFFLLERTTSGGEEEVIQG